MKKFFTGMLALVAAAGLAPTAMAQDEEPMMQFYVHGKPVYNGDRINLGGYYDEMLSQFDPHLTCKTTATDDMQITIDFYKNETTPLDADWVYGAKMTAQCCWPLQCVGVTPGKSNVSNPIIGEMVADEEANMQVHLGIELGEEQTYTDLKVDSEFSFTAQFDEEEVTLVFFVNKPAGVDLAGVEGIDADSNAAPVYYDLQGRQVANPTNGLYIVKTGSKVTKQFIR